MGRPEGDEAAIMAAELVYELSIRTDSPFYVLIDLTGENLDKGTTDKTSVEPVVRPPSSRPSLRVQRRCITPPSTTMPNC